MRKRKKTWVEELREVIILEEDYSLERIDYQSPNNGDDIIFDRDIDYILITLKDDEDLIQELFIPVNIEGYFISSKFLEHKGIMNGYSVLRKIENLFPRTRYDDENRYNEAM